MKQRDLKHHRLWFFAHLGHALHPLFLGLALLSVVLLLPLALVLWFAHRAWFWSGIFIALWLPIGFASLYALTQISGAFCAHQLHQNIGTHAVLEVDGVRMTQGFYPRPDFTAWRDIALIRRVCARHFPDYDVRFGDETAYQIVLQSQESFFVDFIEANSLTLDEIAQHVATEGFAERLLASDYEAPKLPNQKSPLKVL